MTICPFCNQDLLDDRCPVCGYTSLLALPYHARNLSDLVPSLIGILLALSSFAFSSLAPESILALIASVGAIGFCGWGLEKNRSHTRLLLIIGLILGVSGFIWSVLTGSHLPTNGYTM